jgi:hypothetical protein
MSEVGAVFSPECRDGRLVAVAEVEVPEGFQNFLGVQAHFVVSS